MKTCKSCFVSKNKEEFYLQVKKGSKGQKWNYLDNYCFKCRLEYTSNKKLLRKLKAIDYLGGKCVDCGLIDHPSVYDFHHLDSTLKEFSISSKGSRSFETIKSELDKCVLLCANCHRKRHHQKNDSSKE